MWRNWMRPRSSQNDPNQRQAIESDIKAYRTSDSTHLGRAKNLGGRLVCFVLIFIYHWSISGRRNGKTSV